MKVNRTENATRNIVVGMADKIVCIILPFVVRTIVIRVVGAEYLGLNGLFSSVLQVLSVSELGFNSAIVYSMYKPIAENDTDTICALMNFYRKAYRLVGSFIGIVGLCLIPWLGSLISGDPPAGINIYILYLLFLGNTVISYFMFSYKSSLLQAHQRTDLQNVIHIVTQIGTYMMQVLALVVWKDYYLYVAALPIFTIIHNLLIFGQVKKNYPQYKCKGKINTSVLDGIKRQISGLMVSKICTATRTSFDNIFISAFIGLTASAVYSNYMYIMNAVIMILSVVGQSIVAGVGNSLVTESVEKNYSDLRKFNFAYMWISGWCTICLLCLYQPFMELWVGKELMASNTVVVLFCLYFYALKMGDMRSVYSEAAGIWWEMRYRAVVEAVMNLVLNVIFVRILGMAGIILGTLISLLIINFGMGSQIVFKYYFKNEKLWQFFADHLKYFVVTLFAATATWILVNCISIHSFWGLVLKAFVCVIIPNCIYWSVYAKTQEFKSVMKMVSRMKLFKKH